MTIAMAVGPSPLARAELLHLLASLMGNDYRRPRYLSMALSKWSAWCNSEVANKHFLRNKLLNHLFPHTHRYLRESSRT